MKVLFVCLGNICRSPMAEFIAKDYLKSNQINNIEVSSAGTANYHEGSFFDLRTKKVLDKHKIWYDLEFKSKPISQKLFNNFDWIVTMDDQNYHDVLVRFKNSDKVLKITDLSDKFDRVPDPWYDGNFERTFEILSQLIPKLFLKLESK